MPQTTFSQSFMANGNIYPCRFVKLDTTAPFKILQAGANEAILGISQVGTKDPPGVSGSTAYAATAGVECQVFMAGSRTLLELPAAGCTTGDRLGPDADGKGVVVTPGAGTDYWVGALALQTFVAAGLCEVEVIGPYQIGT